MTSPDVATAAVETEIGRYFGATPASAAMAVRARRVLPGGDTRSGTWFAPYPPVISTGRGSELVDVDGNRYVDFLYNYTSLILGHAHPAVVDAIASVAARGTAYAAPTELQVELAERLVSRLPSAERVRFCNSGTEAAILASRCARAATGRPLIAKIARGYHGSYDALDVRLVDPDRPPRDLAPQPATRVLELNDPDRALAILEDEADRLAAVVVEPVMAHSGLITVPLGFLHALRELTERAGALLVLDEVVTFRLGPGGLQREFALDPDLTMLGKIIGGGVPIGAIAGRAKFLDLFDPSRVGSVPHSGTYNGNPLAMAAGIATLDLLDADAYVRLHTLGQRLADGLVAVSERSGQPFRVRSAGSLVQVDFSAHVPHDGAEDGDLAQERHQLFHVGLVNRGFLTAPRGELVVSLATTEAEIDALVTAAAEVVG